MKPGGKPVTLTLKAGKRRTVLVRVKRPGRVTITIRLAGAQRPLATKRLRLR